MRSSTAEAIRPVVKRPRDLFRNDPPEGLLLAPCWCEGGHWWVPAGWVTEGRTASCGLPGCGP